MDASHTTKTSPKDFFLTVAFFVALYVSAVSLLQLWFAAINALFPDPLSYEMGYSATLRVAIASLVVVFPLYVFFLHFLEKDSIQHPEKANQWIRTWLTYLTLFAAGVTLVVDLVVLINTFLGGDVTTRFVLKVLAIFIVAGAVFGYYLRDVRKDDAMRRTASRNYFAWSASLVIALSVVGSFFIIGSPMSERLRRFDEERISHLQNIQSHVVYFWQQKGALPQTLAELQSPLAGFVVPVDPETSAPYKYRPLAATVFEVCADFDTEESASTQGASRAAFAKPIPVYPQGAYPGDINWKHGKGRSCFSRTIDPDLFPVQKKPLMP